MCREPQLDAPSSGSEFSFSDVQAPPPPPHPTTPNPPSKRLQLEGDRFGRTHGHHQSGQVAFKVTNVLPHIFKRLFQYNSICLASNRDVHDGFGNSLNNWKKPRAETRLNVGRPSAEDRSGVSRDKSGRRGEVGGEEGREKRERDRGEGGGGETWQRLFLFCFTTASCD